MLRVGHVFDNMRHLGHAAQHNGDLGVVPDPLECQIGHAASAVRLLQDYCGVLRQLPGESATPQGLHNHHGQASLCGVPEPRRTRLEVYIHVIVLNLTHRPVIVAIHDLLERRKIIMERKAEMSDAAVRYSAFGPVQDTHVSKMGPEGPVQAVQEIEIDALGLQTERIDFYLLHGLNRTFWPPLRDMGVLHWAERAIADGRIGHLGFSFHDDFPTFKEIVDGYDYWTMCQI